MKKLFLAMMACLLVTSSAYAFETSITGSYFVRGGAYDIDGIDADGDVAEANTFESASYDQDLDVKVKINTDENTFLAFALESRDETMNTAGTKAFNVDYVYIQHTFGTGTTVAAGDLNAPLAWGTDFGSYEDEEGFGLQITQEMSFGSLIFATEKITEAGDELGDGDYDIYALGAIINMGDMSIMPRLAYANDDTAGAEEEVIEFDLAYTATFGAVAVEAEFVYQSFDEADYDVFGLYAKASYDFGFMNAGLIAAYASADDDANKGFTMGGDFEPLLLVSNKIEGDVDEFEGMMLVAVTASAPVTDELTITGTFGYMTETDDDATGEADGFEFDLGASYKITDALVYSVNFAYLDGEVADVDVDGFYIDNVLTLTF